MPSASVKRSSSLASLVDAVDRTHLRVCGGTEGKDGSPNRSKLSKSSSAANLQRSRPTNNQLLYKAYFRWDHFPHPLGEGYGVEDLPDETEACASVTSAFLQILSALHEIEQRRKDGAVNVLKLLSTNTRRTKVVELNTGTHRVPDELRKHCLVDEDSNQYSTNLDRNRYGSDDQYLSTVVRFDLDFVGLCPCLVDIEIIDAKSGSESLVIAANKGECNCHDPPKSPNLAQALAASCVQKVAVKPIFPRSTSSIDVKDTQGGMKKSKSGLDMLFFAALDATKPEDKDGDGMSMDKETRKRRKHNEETCGCIICQQKRRARTQGRFPTLKAFKRINSAPALHVEKDPQSVSHGAMSSDPKMSENEEDSIKKEVRPAEVKLVMGEGAAQSRELAASDLPTPSPTFPGVSPAAMGLHVGLQPLPGGAGDVQAKFFPIPNGHGVAQSRCEDTRKGFEKMRNQTAKVGNQIAALIQDMESSTGSHQYLEKLRSIQNELSLAGSFEVNLDQNCSHDGWASCFQGPSPDTAAFYAPITELGRRLAEADSVIAALRMREIELLRALHSSEERARVAELETDHLKQLLSTAERSNDQPISILEEKKIKLETELARLKAQNSRFEENEKLAGMRMAQMLEALNATQHAAATAHAQLLSEQQGKEAHVFQLQKLAKEVTDVTKRAENAEKELAKLGQNVPPSLTQ